MKYLDEYRDGNIARKIVDEIHRIQTKPWVIMEVCGGQTHSIVKHGIDYLLRKTWSWCTGRAVRFALRR